MAVRPGSNCPRHQRSSTSRDNDVTCASPLRLDPRAGGTLSSSQKSSVTDICPTVSVAHQGAAHDASSVDANSPGFVFALPAIALVIGFIGIPIGQAVYYSFTQWDGLTSTWIGPSTWTAGLSQLRTSGRHSRTTRNCCWPCPSPWATAVHRGAPCTSASRVGRSFARSTFLPTAISWVVFGLVAERFFAYQGTLNSIIHAFGFSHTNTNLLGYESTALSRSASPSSSP
jgi:ABC-type sugar transport system permease subunit